MLTTGALCFRVVGLEALGAQSQELGVADNQETLGLVNAALVEEFENRSDELAFGFEFIDLENLGSDMSHGSIAVKRGKGKTAATPPPDSL
jgi:hypothetical protein